MKLVLIIFLLCLLLVDVRSDRSSEKSSDRSSAVYIMSNGVPKNQLFIYRVNKNGRLTGKKTINTGGVGLNTTAIDPLNSQGSMIVYSNYLFVVNAGSNSLSLFAINPRDPTDLKLISVQPTKGKFPASVTVNSRYACVLTGVYPAGIRCFTYNRYGLFVKPSLDRTVPLEVTQFDPLRGPAGTLSQIQFSADNRALIVTIKAVNLTSLGYLLFYRFSNNFATLSSTPTKQRPVGAGAPFSMSLVGKDGLLITEAAFQGILTMKYSSTTGTIRNSVFTPVNASFATVLCWSVYSPTTGNYYAIGSGPPVPGLVELKLDLDSTTKPVTIVRYYPIPPNSSGIDATIVTLGGVDYLYINGEIAQVVNIYRLKEPGNAVFLEQTVAQKSAPNKPWLGGIASYTSSHASSRYY